MTLNMGQWLSIPFIIAGICLIIYALVHPPVKLSFPNKFAEQLEGNAEGNSKKHQK